MVGAEGIEPTTKLIKSQLLYQLSYAPINGTPGQIRTDRTTPFERVDFTNLSTGAKLSEGLSHPPSPAYQGLDVVQGVPLVPPRGIEPRSSVLQTGAMTTSAKAAL